MKKSYDITVDITNDNISLRVIADNCLAVAELSRMDSAVSLSFLQEASDSSKFKNLKEKSIELLQNQPQMEIYFFNRLNVPKKIRDQGIGSILLQKLEKIAQEKNALIINTANAYGDLSQSELIAFYEQYNFKLIHKDGLMVYHNVFLDKKPVFVNTQKFKK